MSQNLVFCRCIVIKYMLTSRFHPADSKKNFALSVSTPVTPVNWAISSVCAASAIVDLDLDSECH